jgi:hypothetical protein
MPPSFASRAAPHYHYSAQPYTAYASDLTGSTPFRGFEQIQQGMNSGPTEQTLVGSGINHSTDVQGASSMGILGDGSNCTVTNSHGPVATPQPLCQDAYTTVSVFYITTRDESTYSTTTRSQMFNMDNFDKVQPVVLGTHFRLTNCPPIPWTFHLSPMEHTRQRTAKRLLPYGACLIAGSAMRSKASFT